MYSRRKILQLIAAATATASFSKLSNARLAEKGIGFGFSLYGMKALPLHDALRQCAEVGYDCIELPTMADWPGSPEKLSKEDRRRFRETLLEHSLRLSALMDNLVLVAPRDVHLKNLDRLKAAAELGHDLNPEGATIIETVMGGQPSQWDEIRGEMAERLTEWAKIAEQSRATIAIKAHIGGAAHRPEHVRWLLDQVKSPSLKAVFDFSHFQLRGLGLKESWDALAKDAVFIHIKDSVGDQQKFQFVLPGEGTVNYVEYLELLRDSGFVGDVVVEVSAQLHNRPDYDPIAACKKAYAIAPRFEQAGVKRN